MKSNKTIATIFFLCAVVFYILALTDIFEEATRDTGITWLCIGSLWLCLGSVYLNKSKNEKDDSDKKEE